MDRKALYITNQEARLQRDGGGLAVYVDNHAAERWPAEDISRVHIFGNAQVTTQALALLFYVGAHVCYFTRSGRYRGQLVSPESGNLFVRLAQHRRHGEPDFRLAFARELVQRKVQASRKRLARHLNNHSDVEPVLSPALARLDAVLAQLPDAANDDELRGLEGSAAAAYFMAFDSMIRAPFRFERRSQHPAHNEVNALLNFGYTLLTTEIAGRLEAAGFDPRVGYYHGVRYGRLSLALDLIEIHRVEVIDRLTLSVLNRRMLCPDEFLPFDPRVGVRLKPPALKRYLALYEAALGDPAPGQDSPRTQIEQQISDLRRAVLSEATAPTAAGIPEIQQAVDEKIPF